MVFPFLVGFFKWPKPTGWAFVFKNNKARVGGWVLYFPARRVKFSPCPRPKKKKNGLKYLGGFKKFRDPIKPPPFCATFPPPFFSPWIRPEVKKCFLGPCLINGKPPEGFRKTVFFFRSPPPLHPKETFFKTKPPPPGQGRRQGKSGPQSFWVFFFCWLNVVPPPV